MLLTFIPDRMREAAVLAASLLALQPFSVIHALYEEQ
jgi:hypothetical protein